MTALAPARPAEPTTAVGPETSPRPAALPPAPVTVVMDFVGATLCELDQLFDGLGLRSGEPGVPGSLFQWVRTTQDGVRVTEVWRSSSDFEAFRRDCIAPNLSAAGLREPEVTTYEVHSYLTEGPSVEAATHTNDGTRPRGRGRTRI